MSDETPMKHAILKAAVRLALARGFRNFSRDDVATEAQTATGTVSYHYRDMSGLRRAVMQYAIDNEVLKIVAQGLADGHTLACRAPEALKQRAARALAT